MSRLLSSSLHYSKQQRPKTDTLKLKEVQKSSEVLTVNSQLFGQGKDCIICHSPISVVAPEGPVVAPEGPLVLLVHSKGQSAQPIQPIQE